MGRMKLTKYATWRCAVSV